MIKLKLFSGILLPLLFLISCEDSQNEPTPSSQVKLRLALVEGSSNNSAGGQLAFSYDSKGRLSKVSQVGDNTQFLDIFYFSGGNIQFSPAGSGTYGKDDAIEAYESENGLGGLHVYKTSIVNGNPIKIEALARDYDWDTDQYVSREITINIEYDNKINPLYMLLEQSEMLPTFDDLILNSPDPLYSSIKASGLLAKNNAVKLSVLDENGQTLAVVNISYQYNNDNLPEVMLASDGVDQSIVKFFYQEIN